MLENMLENIKKNKWHILGILVMAAAPILLYIGLYKLDIGWFSKGENGDWLGFWGGYLGAIFGIIGAVLLSRMERLNDREQQSQFLVVTLYIEKMEKLLEYLLEIEAFCGDIYQDIIELEKNYRSDSNEEQIAIEKIFDDNKEVQKKILKIKTLYSYFSGNDTYLIKVNQAFSEFVEQYREYVMRRDTETEKIYNALDNFEVKLNDAQAFATREITLKLIAIQSTYADPKEFVNEYQEG